METPSIAVIGASSNREKYGNKALRAWIARGYTVYPINPNENEVEGIPTFASVTDVPNAIDQATLYVPPEVGIRVLEDVHQKGIQKIFVNPGAGSPELMERAAILGIEAIEACSIIAAGSRPEEP